MSAKDKDAGIDALDIYSERGYAQFTAGALLPPPPPISPRRWSWARRRAAATCCGCPTRSAWLHIARARAGENDAEELARNAGKINVKQWPGTLVAYFLGQAKIDELTAGVEPRLDGSLARMRSGFLCRRAGARQKGSRGGDAQFTRARAACNIHTVYYLITGVELKRLGK